MTRKVWITSEPFPTSPEVLALARDAGATEIVHSPQGELSDLREGFHEIIAPVPPAPAPTADEKIAALEKENADLRDVLIEKGVITKEEVDAKAAADASAKTKPK